MKAFARFYFRERVAAIYIYRPDAGPGCNLWRFGAKAMMQKSSSWPHDAGA